MSHSKSGSTPRDLCL